MFVQDENFWVIFNPHKVPDEDLVAVYGFINTRITPRHLIGVLLSSEGDLCASCVSTNEEWLQIDLGLVAPSSKHHETLKEMYPNGYRMEYVPFDKRETHWGLSAAGATFLQKEG